MAKSPEDYSVQKPPETEAGDVEYDEHGKRCDLFRRLCDSLEQLAGSLALVSGTNRPSRNPFAVEKNSQ